MAERKRIPDISISDAKILWPNFSGKEGTFNPPGVRNFCVQLDDEIAESLRQDNWNVKITKPKVEGYDPIQYLQVAVRFDNFPPKIVMITSHGKTKIGEDEVNSLDWADLKKVDVIITPYLYNVNGHEGVKAYLKALYVTIQEDEFESLYFDVPDSAENTIHCDHCTGCGDCERAAS